MEDATDQLSEAFAIVGRVAVSLSMAEYHLELLIALYLGEDAGPLVLEELGRNRDKSPLLRTLAKELEPDPVGKDLVLDLVRCYSIARENRNVLLHSFHLGEDNGNIILERSSGKASVQIARSEMTLNEMRAVLSEVRAIMNQAILLFTCKAQQLGYKTLFGSIQIGWPEPLREPRKLTAIDPATVAASLTPLRKRDAPHPDAQSGAEHQQD
jgi:hypothetical protein